jgi:hypothetical protein
LKRRHDAMYRALTELAGFERPGKDLDAYLRESQNTDRPNWNRAVDVIIDCARESMKRHPAFAG